MMVLASIGLSLGIGNWDILPCLWIRYIRGSSNGVRLMLFVGIHLHAKCLRSNRFTRLFL